MYIQKLYKIIRKPIIHNENAVPILEDNRKTTDGTTTELAVYKVTTCVYDAD